MESHNYAVLKAFIAGSCSGTCSAVLFQPLDLMKTRLQSSIPVSSSNMINSSGSAAVMRPFTMFSLASHILQKEQLFGLWKGVTPSLLRCVPGVGLYFSSLHILSTHFADGNPGPLQAVVLGSAARSFSAICLIPMTVVKVRYESDVYQYRGMIHALRSIYNVEGTRGLTCGLIPTLLRDAPFSGLYLMFYTQAKRSVPQEWSQSNQAPTIHFCCGLFAGLLASTVTQPADVIKTKMQLYPNKFPHLHNVILYIYQKYGPLGYFKGLSPRILRRSMMAAMAWTVYEQVSRKLGLKNK